MLGLIAILPNLAKALAIIAVVAATAMVQVAYEYEEAGYIRLIGLIIFIGLAAVSGLVASCENWYATSLFIVVLLVFAARSFKERVDSFAMVAIGALVLYIVTPTFSGHPIVWDGWTILLIATAIIGIVAVKFSVVVHDFIGRSKRSGHPIVWDGRTVLTIVKTAVSSGPIQTGPEAVAVSGRPAYGLFKAVAVTSACLSLASIVALFILVA